ncbi:glycosyltransferase [Spirosoma radiotolerans]|uniref:Glycosyl transferase family 2 n=1 Tax=Spirosoma radiotolerans TaxID=1379870 RepID=A0A0E3ZV55_9BACT|nr:glycosyltransferase family 2 protein [Spirosoma radiotolerans]AKD55603.1 glycosyl transferase family 2 [Spirosoma radiotolerans]
MPVIDEPARDRPGPDFPFVSILIAARNEEDTILDCLRAITQLNYPPERVEVLIGNDQSTDQTRTRVAEFIADKPAFHLIDIAPSSTGLLGKANVLAQLARQARGSLFFFTDADTQVPVNWLTEMSRQFIQRRGIVTGVTLPKGSGLFQRLQTIDWLYNLTLTHLVSLVGIPVTAMGNNMAVSRAGYEAVGGYESLPFSVVEDYTLFQAIVSKGYGFRNLLNEQVLAETKPVSTLRAFLQQRKRWMRGATDLPNWMVISLYTQYLVGPLLLLIGYFSPELAIGLYVIKLLIQTMLLSFGLSRLKQTNLGLFALLFEPYQLLIGPLSVVFYLLPTPIEWKGRQYT